MEEDKGEGKGLGLRDLESIEVQSGELVLVEHQLEPVSLKLELVELVSGKLESGELGLDAG